MDDDDFGTLFDLSNSSVTIINPRDEDPLDSNHDGTYIQYLHGGVSVTGDKLSFGLVFRYVMGEVTYSQTTHRMQNIITGSQYNYGNLYDNFDQGQFITNLRLSYINTFYQSLTYYPCVYFITYIL